MPGPTFSKNSSCSLSDRRESHRNTPCRVGVRRPHGANIATLFPRKTFAFRQFKHLDGVYKSLGRAVGGKLAVQTKAVPRVNRREGWGPSIPKSEMGRVEQRTGFVAGEWARGAAHRARSRGAGFLPRHTPRIASLDIQHLHFAPAKVLGRNVKTGHVPADGQSLSTLAHPN